MVLAVVVALDNKPELEVIERAEEAEVVVVIFIMFF
jgi:fructose-specific component phosphotransferase system IIB-like protein